ncbi:hypothetical protein DAPPUDRAFT_240134 [Daphnia pulex]|uniref:Uncharacterized protein n=1 Tax=Daphnia pulex TaxID=6669 RepID=E9GAY6_DAPPU|nr:hypothetical protein DAPPUDRAFT_240134 [Daphnia pulex]|eukprot:EFX83464.1 hypothetical protein DAPPUDRAFT_240134 [Daphnia pulex]
MGINVNVQWFYSPTPVQAVAFLNFAGFEVADLEVMMVGLSWSSCWCLKLLCQFNSG